MSGQAPIDVLKFARDGERLDGEIAVAAMPRMQDIVAETCGTVRYSIRGSIDSKGAPVIDVTVASRLRLTCQRCLEPVEFDLDRTSRLILVDGGQALPDVAEEDPESESIPVGAFGDIEDVVEQEVLLGVPLAPTHDQCARGDAHLEGDRRRSSPFAVLEQLKSGS